MKFCYLFFSFKNNAFNLVKRVLSIFHPKFGCFPGYADVDPPVGRLRPDG